MGMGKPGIPWVPWVSLGMGIRSAMGMGIKTWEWEKHCIV